MLLQQLFNDPIQFILILPCILIALTFHEWAHGYVAYKCGDNTARNLGRLSLNPLAHLDPIGALMMLVFGFGWAKPVPINTRNFKHPRRDFAIVAVAGPAMNLLLAFGASLFVSIIQQFGYTLIFGYQIGTDSSFAAAFVYYALIFFSLFALINIGLAVFNLIPIPPFDGSRVVSWLLPPRLSMRYNRIENYTRYIVLAIILLSWAPEPISDITYYLFLPVSWLRLHIADIFILFWDSIVGLIWKL